MVKGTSTALITPFTNDKIDFDALEKLLEFQLNGGVNSLVVLGTTGEPATMSREEKISVVQFVVDFVKGRLPIIVGAGSNSTSQAIENALLFTDLGADGLLMVTPYYNKCTQAGLVAHFTKVAEKISLPIILYNVPGRTGVNMLPDTFSTLAEIDNIVAVKEASGNMAQVMDIFQKCGDRIDVYSGEDGLVVPMLAMGGMGCISVMSNVVPSLCVEMTRRFFAGDIAGAAQLQCRLLPLVGSLFCEVNPIPAKAAVSAMGFGQEHIRLPLTPMEDANRIKLFEHMKELGVEI
ncbi:MAG: 4-hydroxy-tetrahydrodipicolinate synthase [Clostridia bacterium]|nr:4-hydroxy-tetrahydrodipicolinate synthase [Clostridia bacterium]